MIILTGGAGFIGSAVLWKLNMEGVNDVIVVDDLRETEKWKNLLNLSYLDYFNKTPFLKMVLDDQMSHKVDAVIHLGACSSTTERDADYLMENNYRYSRILAEWALSRGIRFIYASSAATYGDGSLGFSDDDDISKSLRPINMYGYSKQLFDLWVLRNGYEKKFVGIKFFNVFGPNEYHKGDMRSVVHKSYGQIVDTGKVRLFRSHEEDYMDGEQKRDFVYVKDCAEIIWWLVNNGNVSGIFNLGTGKARTWKDLVGAVFAAMGRDVAIEYIDMPANIRRQYQYFTEARMEKLRGANCPIRFHSLEDAVDDYVKNYIQNDDERLK